MTELKNMGLTLSIDTSVANGSLSLWNKGIEISSIIGNNEVSRSEDILEIISELLDRCKFEPKVVKQIVYTNGPGSYTGLRVGVSTVLGLRAALGCPIYPVSVFEAFSTQANPTGVINTALLLNKNSIAVLRFSKIHDIDESDSIEYYNIREFTHVLSQREERFIIDKRIRPLLINSDVETNNTTDASDNVANLAYQFYFKNLHLVTKREHSIIYASDL